MARRTEVPIPSDFADAYGGYAQGTPPLNIPRSASGNTSTFGPFDTSSPGSFIQSGFAAGDPVFGALFGGGDKPKRPPSGKREYYKGRALLNAYNWLLPATAETTELGADVFGDIFRRQASKARAYELSQFEDYAPLFAQAILNADPRQAEALESLNVGAQGFLDDQQAYADRLGSRLDEPFDPSIYRDITQASLGQSALQGFGNQPRDAALAYVQSGLVGNQLQQQREANYRAALQGVGGGLSTLQNVVGANKSVLGDPFLAFTGRPAQPQGANVQSPNYAGFTDDLFSYGVNQEIQRANLSAANSASNKAMIGQIVGGLLGAGGKLGRAAICWVAREVFGADDSRWLQFRFWMFTRAPKGFLWWYIMNGEAYAQWLKSQPIAKAMWRWWMSERIKEL